MGTDPIKDYEKGTIDIEKLKDLIKKHIRVLKILQEKQHYQKW